MIDSCRSRLFPRVTLLAVLLSLTMATTSQAQLDGASLSVVDPNGGLAPFVPWFDSTGSLRLSPGCQLDGDYVMLEDELAIRLTMPNETETDQANLGSVVTIPANLTVTSVMDLGTASIVIEPSTEGPTRVIVSNLSIGAGETRQLVIFVDVDDAGPEAVETTFAAHTHLAEQRYLSFDNRVQQVVWICPGLTLSLGATQLRATLFGDDFLSIIESEITVIDAPLPEPENGEGGESFRGAAPGLDGPSAFTGGLGTPALPCDDGGGLYFPPLIGLEGGGPIGPTGITGRDLGDAPVIPTSGSFVSRFPVIFHDTLVSGPQLVLGSVITTEEQLWQGYEADECFNHPLTPQPQANQDAGEDGVELVDVAGEPHLRISWTGTGFVNVLVDANLDQAWEDCGERLATNAELSGTLVPLTGLGPGYLALRVTLTADPLPPCWFGGGGFSSGETEDYVLDIPSTGGFPTATRAGRPPRRLDFRSASPSFTSGQPWKLLGGACQGDHVVDEWYPGGPD